MAMQHIFTDNGKAVDGYNLYYGRKQKYKTMVLLVIINDNALIIPSKMF